MSRGCLHRLGSSPKCRRVALGMWHQPALGRLWALEPTCLFFFFKHRASHSSCCMHTNASVCSIIGHLFWWSCYRNFTASVSKQPYNDSFPWIAHGKTPHCLFSWQTVFWLTCTDAMRFLPDVKCCSCSVAELVPRASSTGQLSCSAPLTVAWIKADCRQSPAGDKGAEQRP